MIFRIINNIRLNNIRLNNKGINLVELVIALGVSSIVMLAVNSITELAVHGKQAALSQSTANDLSSAIRERLSSPDLCAEALNIDNYILPSAYQGASGFLNAGPDALLNNSNGFSMSIDGFNMSQSGASVNSLSGNTDIASGNLKIQDLYMANPRAYKIDGSGKITGLADIYLNSNTKVSGMQLKPRFIATLILTEDPATNKFESCQASAAVGFRSFCIGMGCTWSAGTNSCDCPRPSLEGCPPYYVPVGFLTSGLLDCRYLGGGECPAGYGLKSIDIDKISCVPIGTYQPNYTYSWSVSNGACVSGFYVQVVNGCFENPGNRQVATTYCTSPLPAPTPCP